MLAGTRDFSLHQNVVTSSGAHPASYSMGTRVHTLPGVQQIWHKVNNLVQLVIRLRTNAAVPVLPRYDFRAWTRETFGYGYDLL
jgi:hypothetical protein